MDFFEAQARARKRTSRLVVLFALAVLGTIVALYGVALAAGVGSTLPQKADVPGEMAANLWDPALFGWVTLGTLTVVGLGSLYQWNRFRAGGSAVAESVGARRLDPGSTEPLERRLLNVVEEMSIAAGLPVPAVYVMDEEPAINAFAAGLTTQDAVVAVTRGTLEKLNRDELQGVVGHEFSHVLNGDMRLNVRLSAILHGILVIGLIGRGLLRHAARPRVRRSSDRQGAGGVAGLLAIGLALLVIGYVGYFFGRLIQAAVSRQREFLADASAVQFTRNPAGITGALKKIGGHALGSSIVSSRGAALGHFFFAQGFRSWMGSLWATHPPLAERIRAIDPTFDGQMLSPPAVVDIARESFASAGLAPAAPPVQVAPAPLAPASATAAVAAIGSLSPAQIHDARLLLESVPAGLREAARSPSLAPILVCGLLLGREPELRNRQLTLIATRAGAVAATGLAQLEPALATLRSEHLLPLLHLALPVLRTLPAAELSTFLDTLDELVHADAQVSTFEFALQKVLVHALSLGAKPGQAVQQYQSFHAVAGEVAVLLSALARAASSDPAFAGQAFQAGARQLPLLADRLRLLEPGAAGFEQLDLALDKLAAASGPIKQRVLLAAAATVCADGQILITEAELLRATAAALDCPMPALTTAG